MPCLRLLPVSAGCRVLEHASRVRAVRCIQSLLAAIGAIAHTVAAAATCSGTARALAAAALTVPAACGASAATTIAIAAAARPVAISTYAVAASTRAVAASTRAGVASARAVATSTCTIAASACAVATCVRAVTTASPYHMRYIVCNTKLSCVIYCTCANMRITHVCNPKYVTHVCCKYLYSEAHYTCVICNIYW